MDFGSVYVAGLAELHRPLVHEGALGTAGYSDPLYLMGKNPGIQGDVYALATIAYETFTAELPYGDGVEECRTAFDYDRLRYRSASEHNPVIPVWFDGALEKGVAFDLQQRYNTIDELVTDLTHPNPAFLKADPVAESTTSSLAFWKLMSGFWVLDHCAVALPVFTALGAVLPVYCRSPNYATVHDHCYGLGLPYCRQIFLRKIAKLVGPIECQVSERARVVQETKNRIQ